MPCPTRRTLRTVLSAGLVVPIVVVLAGIAPGGQVPAYAAVPTGSEVGFSQSHLILWESDADLAADLDAMQAVGAKWVRVDFDWSSIQPTSPTKWSWAPTDRVVNAARARGLEVLAMPAYTPPWARAAGTTDKYPPTNPDHYAAFVAAATARYKPLGVRHWEIWNEPNISMFWAPKPDAAAYTTLLGKAATAIRGVDPAAVVISAGLSPAPDASDGTLVSPLTFLRRMYDNGAGPSLDAVGHHPYSFPYEPMYPGSWNAFYTASEMHALMQQRGDGAKKIWATEVGFPTGTASGRSVDEATQATRVRQLLSAWFDWSFHGPIFWFSMRDFSTNQSDYTSMFGLLRKDFSQKPAYAAMADVLSAPAPTTTTAAPAPTTTAAPAPTTTAAPAPTTTAAPAPTTTAAPAPTTTAAPAPTTTAAPAPTTTAAPAPTTTAAPAKVTTKPSSSKQSDRRRRRHYRSLRVSLKWRLLF